MFAVIFIVEPKTERFDDYLSLAKQLKPKLEAIDGFVDNDRFKSERDDKRLVSLSTWRDEKAVIRWRTEGEHHGVQEKGRFEVFKDYHLRVGEIVADTDGKAAPPARQQHFDETETGDAKVVTLTEVTPEQGHTLDMASLAAGLGLQKNTPGLIDREAFASIYVEGKLLMLGCWRDNQAAQAFQPQRPNGAKSLRHRAVRVIRDYGMFDRREAPQYYPAVDKKAG